MTGDVAEVARRLERDPEIAGRKLAPSGWEPLLYACFSRFLRADPDRAESIVAVVRILLDAGADPNVMWFEGEFRELPIFGAAGIANSPVLTQMLLDAGADPNETYEDPEPIGEALYHAVEFPDLTCARLLIEAGTLPNRVAYCLGRVLDFPNPAMVEMFLAHGVTPHGGNLQTAVFRSRCPVCSTGPARRRGPVRHPVLTPSQVNALTDGRIRWAMVACRFGNGG